MGGSFVVELARRATHKEGNVPRMRQSRMVRGATSGSTFSPS